MKMDFQELGNWVIFAKKQGSFGSKQWIQFRNRLLFAYSSGVKVFNTICL